MEEKKEQPEWLKRARQNDKNAWESLVRENERMVYHIAYRMMQNEEDAKDISQEIFIKVYRSLSKFDESAVFSTWLYRIAVNTCIDALRKRKGNQTISLQEQTQKKQQDTPEQNYLQKEEQIQIMQTIESLSPEPKDERYGRYDIWRDCGMFISFFRDSKITDCESEGTI